VGGIECGIGIRRQGSRCDSRRQASRCDSTRYRIESCFGRRKYQIGRWETGDSPWRPETGFRGEAMGDKSPDRILRETGIRTGASPTGRTRHGRPGHLTLSRQNIFFADVFDCNIIAHNITSASMPPTLEKAQALEDIGSVIIAAQYTYVLGPNVMEEQEVGELEDVTRPLLTLYA